MLREDSGDDLVGQIFGWVGTVIAMFFFISPVVPITQLIKGKVTWKEIPGVLLICSFMNCILWADYGLKGNLPQVYTTNGIGGTIILIWIMVFLIYFAEKKFCFSFGLILILLVVIIGIGYVFYFIIKEDVTGFCAMGFNILMYAAPGEKIYTVIKTKNYKLIPIYSSIAGFSCSSCSLIYGIYLNNLNIIVPNGLGLFFSILQLILYLIIKKRNPIRDSEINKKLKDEGNNEIKPVSQVEEA